MSAFTTYVIIRVLTPWVAADPAADPRTLAIANHPKFRDDYEHYSTGEITGQDHTQLIPDPNITVLSALVTEPVYLSIIADGVYEVLSTDGVVEIEILDEEV